MEAQTATVSPEMYIQMMKLRQAEEARTIRRELEVLRDEVNRQSHIICTLLGRLSKRLDQDCRYLHGVMTERELETARNGIDEFWPNDAHEIMSTPGSAGEQPAAK